MDKLLDVAGIATFYGHSQALFEVSLTINTGEVVTLLGRNGMGKTTTVRSIMGLTPPAEGSIKLRGTEVRGMPAFRVAQRGIGLVPEGRHVFPNLTVRENLVAAAGNRQGAAAPWELDGIYELFPPLAQRAKSMGGHLSGGEQQMLAIGRALMTNPLLLVLDEATEGLAPRVRDEIWDCLIRLKATGQSILLIDKNLTALLEISDRHYILEKGRVVWTGTSRQLEADETAQSTWLSI